MTERALPVLIRGENLLLHPGRAVVWPRRRTVIVADTHFGKSGYFGRHGIAVPGGSDEADRDRLHRLITDADATRLVILGDFLHAPPAEADSRAAEGDSAAAELRAWAEHVGKIADIHVVAGNHDPGSRWTPPEPLRWWESWWADPPFRFIHDAARAPSGSDSLYALSGHLHPVVRLRAGRKGVMRVPVFWQRAQGMILPSFGLFTGGFAVRAAPGERLYAAGSEAVVPLVLRA